MKRPVRHGLAVVAVTIGAVGAGMPGSAQPAKPNYLPFVEFAPRDTEAQIDLKRAYNDAVERYNKILYEYHATLGQHDRLVDTYNGTTDPAERQRIRDEAAPLRAQLATLRREAGTLFSAVDQAARRSTAGGVPVKP